MFLPLVPQLADDGDDDEVLLLLTDAVDSAVETESREKAEEDGKKSKQRQQQRQKQNRARMRLDTVSCRKENKKKNREREREIGCWSVFARVAAGVHTYIHTRAHVILFCPPVYFFLPAYLLLGFRRRLSLKEAVERRRRPEIKFDRQPMSVLELTGVKPPSGKAKTDHNGTRTCQSASLFLYAYSTPPCPSHSTQNRARSSTTKTSTP